MSKSDSDNRSNQLNPNNAAYYSSRATGEGDYDDEDLPNPHYRAPDTNDYFRELIQQQQRIEEQKLIVKIFRYDVLFLNGRTASLSQAIGRDSSRRTLDRISDHLDIFDKIENSLARKLEEVAGALLANSIVRDENGRQIKWLGASFLGHQFPPTNQYGEVMESKVRNIQLWNDIAKPKIPHFTEAVLADRLPCRKDYTEPVTPQNYSRYDWPNLEVCVA